MVEIGRRGENYAISIVIDVKAEEVVDDLSPAIRHIYGYRLPCFFLHSSCFSWSPPSPRSPKGEKNDDDDVRVLDARGRTMDIDPFVAYFSTPWSQIGSHYGEDSIKIGPTLEISISRASHVVRRETKGKRWIKSRGSSRTEFETKIEKIKCGNCWLDR